MSSRTIARLVALLSLVGVLSGCVVHDGEADVTFLWDPAECAGIGRLDVVLEDLDDGSVDEIVGVPCSSGGFTVEDLDPGRYVVTFYGDGFLLVEQGIRLRSGDNRLDVVLTE